MLILESTHEIIDQLAFDADGFILSAGINYGAKSRKRVNVGIDRWHLSETKPIARFFAKQFVSGFMLNPRSPWLYACTHDASWRLNSSQLDGERYAAML